ncbi:MAG: hypothetical protein JSV07_06045 [Acidimicrobiia bacterium]|nr:MAG: hypothetical protein JSV07_06045 [Acidimicrobiia bacterium]
MSDVVTLDRRPPKQGKRAPKGARVFGDFIAILVNLVVLWIVRNLLAWGWFGWLTEDFSEVVPLIRLQILVTVGTHIVFVIYDPRWMRSWGEVVTGAFGLVAAVALWRVFPFAFDATLWTNIARFAIAVGIVGTVIGMLVNLVKGTRQLFG